MSIDMRYAPTSGPLSGISFEKQTERAFNELGVEIDNANATASNALSIANLAFSTANQAVLVAQAATEAANNASQQATDSSNTAQNALAAAQTAQSSAQAAMNQANAAMTTAQSAFSGIADVRTIADNALSAANNAQNAANTALAQANTVMQMLTQAFQYTVFSDAVDLNAIFFAKKLYPTGTVSNAPIIPPFYLDVVNTDDQTGATQRVWSPNSPQSVYSRSAAIALDVATQTYTPTWGTWAASGGKTPFFQVTGSSTDPNYKGDALDVDASLGVAIGSVTVSGGIAGPTQNIVVIGNQAVASSAANEAVVIGQKASAAQYASDTVIIGSQASVGNYGQYSVAIGEKASSNKANSVAIGYESTVTQTNEFSVGNSTQQRVITNVAPGVNPTDAVNVSQLAGIGASGPALPVKPNVITSTRNYIAPVAGLYRVTVVGGGASGGKVIEGASGSYVMAAGGGGAGGTLIALYQLNAGDTIPIQIGSGATPSNGAGGSTTFDTLTAGGGLGGDNVGTLAMFQGGQGGIGGTNTVNPSSFTSFLVANIPGGCGLSPTWSAGSPYNQMRMAGGGASMLCGNTTASWNGGNTGMNGVPGSGYGGGGSGAISATTQGGATWQGGQGANGVVIVEEPWN